MILIKRKIAVFLICAAAVMFPAGMIASDTVAVAKLDLPRVQSFTLENGVRVFYIQDELPQLTIIASFGFGRLYETESNAGMADLVAKTLSIAGSKAYPGIKLHEKVDSMGGILKISSSHESTVISLQVLSRFKDEAFQIVSDLIANPNFEDKHFQTARALLADEIKRRNDKPALIAFDRTLEMIFNGRGFGAVPTEGKVSSYTLGMVTETWDRCFKGKNLLIGISSSIGYQAIREASLSHFSGFGPGNKISYTVDSGAIDKKIREGSSVIYFYPKDIPQSSIVMGTVAPDVHYRGSYALTIMDFILGGGSFNSRLMREIRDKRGLAYSTYSDVRFMSRTGVFFAFAQTSNETVDTVLALMKENIDLMANERITDKELGWAKNSFNNSFIFRFATPMDVLGNYIYLEYNELPENYFRDYLRCIGSVSSIEVTKESKSLFKSGFITCVVGKEDLKIKLQKFGQVILIK